MVAAAGGKMHKYRFLLNLARFLLHGFVDLPPIEEGELLGEPLIYYGWPVDVDDG